MIEIEDFFSSFDNDKRFIATIDVNNNKKKNLKDYYGYKHESSSKYEFALDGLTTFV